MWRSHRAFHIVHVPSLIAVLTLLDDIDQMSKVSEQDQDDIYASVHRAATLAFDLRKAIEQSALDKAKIELRVLEKYARPPLVPLTKASKLTRTVDSISTSSGSIWNATKSGALGAVSSVQSGISQTASRAIALPMFAKTLQKSMTGAMSDTLLEPVTMRLRAGTRAIENGV